LAVVSVFQTRRSSLLKIAFPIVKIIWQMSLPIRLVSIQLQPNIQSLRPSEEVGMPSASTAEPKREKLPAGRTDSKLQVIYIYIYI